MGRAVEGMSYAPSGNASSRAFETRPRGDASVEVAAPPRGRFRGHPIGPRYRTPETRAFSSVSAETTLGAPTQKTRRRVRRYAERKWALRGFWAGNGFILLACIALAWVKFETAIASAVTCVLVVFIAANTYYIYKITRPRFRMPKNAERRRPKAGDFDEMRGAAPRNTIGAGGGDGDVEVGPPPNRRTPSKRS